MTTYLSAATSPTATSYVNETQATHWWQCILTGTGDVGAVLTIEETFDGTNFSVMKKVALCHNGGEAVMFSLATGGSGIRVKLWAISGTSAAVTVLSNI